MPALNGLTERQGRALIDAAALVAGQLDAGALAAGWNSGDQAPPVRAGKIIDQALRLHAAAKLTSPVWNDYISVAIGPAILQVRESLWEVPGAQPLKLTEKERDLLMVLYLAPAQQASREELLDKVWGYRADLETHTLETHIYRLRQKIERSADQPAILVTVPNGYALAAA